MRDTYEILGFGSPYGFAHLRRRCVRKPSGLPSAFVGHDFIPIGEHGLAHKQRVCA